jgi:carbamoyl-phosphate synthase small subunit
MVQSYVDRYSHHAATRSLGAWLEAEDIPGIDTRTLTRRLREHGLDLTNV